MNLKFNLKKTLSFSLVVLIGIFLLGSNARAGLSDNIGDFVGSLIGLLISGIGLILVLVMKGLIIVAQYSNFLGAPAVANGWVTVRDICNMFFVIILLVIAFATILRIESYNYKKWLPKLILMAILINYSKTICGILIDATQIVMLTFVNAFKDVAGGNLIQMFGINDILTFAQKSDSVGFWAIVGSYMLGLIYIIIALIVVLAMTAMLVMRIVMIWIYVVLSPLAYLLSAFPGGQKYASQWWSEFIKNLIVGPVLAFFIWLSFVAVGSGTMADQGFSGKSNVDANSAGLGGDGGEQTAVATAATNAGTTEVFIKFIVAIGMLLGGMQITQQIGGAAAGVAGKVFSKGKGIALGAGVGALALAKRGAKNAGMAAVNQKGVRGALDTIGAQKGVLGQALRFTGIRGLAREGSLALGKHKLEVEEKAKKKVEAFRKVGATETLTSLASGRADTIGQKAAKKEARKIVIVPEENFDKTEGAIGLVNQADKDEAVSRLKDLDFKKDTPSLNQVMQLGKSDINLSAVPKFQAWLEQNAEARGAYNSGQRDAGLRNYVVGRNRNGQALTGRGRYGTMTPRKADRDRGIGRTGDTTYSLRTTEKKEEIKKSVNTKDSEEVIKQRERIASITGSSNQELIEKTRNKISDWNVQSSTDNFQNDNQIKEAFSQVQTEKNQEQIIASQQKQRISEVTGETTNQDLLERTRVKLDSWNTADGQDHFQDEQQVKKAFEQSKIDEQKDQAKEKEEAQKNIPGSGSLSINNFARGQSSLIGVDFSKLSPDIQAKLKPADNQNIAMQEIKGAQTFDKNEIKNIASSLLGVINNEIRAIESKSGGATQGDQHRLANLQAAQTKLKNSEKISDLQLVNSGALGYTSVSDVKETMIHEGTHGLGIKNESDTDYITKQAMTLSGKERAEIREGGSKFTEHLEDKMDLDTVGYIREKGKGQTKKPIKDVLHSEDDDEDLSEYNLRTSNKNIISNNRSNTVSGQENIVNEENITNVTNVTNISKDEKEKMKQNFKVSSAQNSNDSFMAYYFRQFISSLNKLRAGMSQNKPVAPEKTKPIINIEPTEVPDKEDKDNPKIDLVV